MSRFFIGRPIFAWVIAIIIMLAGTMAILTLPVAQYPTIAPPAIQISATYQGASAKTVEDSVTQVIEQNMTGLDNLMYMSSTSDSSGNASITLTFEAGTDPDIAQVQVQNNLQRATSQLPTEVQQLGISVRKSTSSFMSVTAFVSTDNSMTGQDIMDYVSSRVKDPVSRVAGVGDVMVFGTQYAMRIWLDPAKLNSYNLTPIDIVNAIRQQNTQVTVGQIGGAPAVKGQMINATITARNRLESVQQFKDILLRVNKDGSQIRIKDVARVELGGESSDFITRFDGKPASGIGIKLATGANALDTQKAVDAKLEELSANFPQGLKMYKAMDTNPFVKLSIEEVVSTLFEAIVLVFLVMYLFLQNIRATLIPTIAVPVVLLGTFGVMAACGFTINTLTMFGLVLAIGLLVDDAIVVVENVERVMSEEGLSPVEATKKSMGQISGALVGVAMVLSAVFVPMAFMTGSTGAIYRQFSLTIVAAMVLSVLVAMILTPALCATMLKAGDADHGEKKGFFGWFNRIFDRTANGYQSSVAGILKRSGRFVIVYLLLLPVIGWMFKSIPSSFLPNEDQGNFMVMVQLPPGASLERSQKVMDEVTHYFETEEKSTVESVFTVSGFSFVGQAQNAGMAFVGLKDWSERTAPGTDVNSIIKRAMIHFKDNQDAMIFAVNPPAIRELGQASGFDFFLEDRAGLGHEKLLQARNQLLGMANQNPALQKVRPNGLEDNSQFFIDLDYEKAKALGIDINDINKTLSIAWGSSYVNDFIDRGRIKKVYVQADAPYRMSPKDISDWYVRNNKGEMVPFSAFSQSHWGFGSPRLARYNGNSAFEILGEAAPGYSTGEAMAAIEQIASKLPEGITVSWTGMSYQERLAGSQAPMLYALSMLVVFLCLAALYESWSVPIAVILVVPLGVLGALAATMFRGLENDVYFQVGLLTTIGLAAKNAILIVEFAKELHEKGMGLIEATVEACRMRLRPIIMTSLAFILGVLPLVMSSGAGANSRHAIGTSVMGGMISATVLAIFFVPLFFVLITKLFTRKKAEQ
ncbi:TPA: efflux RND transporter permease subunit [Photobacterium damselae]|uniref:efflux RND transporter permease subunit n=1 Tax=Photobacterium damselae TaxID=38293 RepID=UPI00084B55FB|nr:efflux RND transporter permease subunit [Photobacterium damselae]ELV7515753.1 efflux RND transporter permease subunit [Photobacterium damselae]KAB1179215.1 efflux RND transporter permease subunit [Photobacterium damselae subsp. damselae]MBF7101171.1 efflux RND transporter permease subunit [Photobacterium damselae]MDC4167434.1 efflux RND transporter permease subunit [Photobacterium damselae]NVH47725.1 efflux RND transporter permease subunit [Photobacterium damselae subsp. damselae]